MIFRYCVFWARFPPTGARALGAVDVGSEAGQVGVAVNTVMTGFSLFYPTKAQPGIVP
jgi:hypothetical protein